MNVKHFSILNEQNWKEMDLVRVQTHVLQRKGSSSCTATQEAKLLEKNAIPTAGTSYSTHPAPSSPSSAWATSGARLVFSCGNSSQMSRRKHISCTLLFEHQLRTNLTALPGLEETLHFPSNLLEPLYHFHNWDLEQWLHLWLHCFHSNLYSIWTISLSWLGSTGGRKVSLAFLYNL